MFKFLLKTVSLFYDKILNPLLTVIYLNYHNVKYSKTTKIYGKTFILNNGLFKIGNNVIINSRYKSNPIGGASFCSFWIKAGGNISIGDGCGISNSAFVSRKSILIGENVYIGGDCKFYDTDFHSLDIKNRLSRPDKNVKSKAIIIEDNAFIGGGSIILKGVKIGHNSVVGAGSVVTKEIPPNQIWAGNPAKYIKKIKI